MLLAAKKKRMKALWVSVVGMQYAVCSMLLESQDEENDAVALL